MKTEKMTELLYNEAAANGLVPVLHANFLAPLHIELGFDRDVCACSVDELDLSVRALNCLKRANIMTVKQLVEFAGTDELLKIRNLGKKSYIEIQTKLLSFGYYGLGEKSKLRFWEAFLQNNKLRA